MDTKLGAKALLKAYFQNLAQVHKALLNYQKEKQEKADGVKLSAYDLWHLASAHPDYVWLRLLSKLMAHMDEAMDQKGADLDALQKEMAAQLDGIFNDPAQHVDFKVQLNMALESNPEVCLQVAALRKVIAA